MKYLPRFLVLIVLVLWSGAARGQVGIAIKEADHRNSPQIVKAFRPVIAGASESTVRIKADGKDVAFGTVVDANGLILTKWSEIKDKKEIVCTLKNGVVLLDAQLVNKDEDYDLALLKVPARGLKPIEWRPSTDAAVGRWVASASNGADPVAVGVVSVARRKWVGGDQPLGPDSGFMGVLLETVPTGGAKIISVVPAGAAAKAGLKANDIVYEASGQTIPDHESLIIRVHRLKAGDKLLMKFKRGDEDKEVELILGKIDPKQLNKQETMGTKLSLRRGGFPFILQHDSGVAPEHCGGPLVDLNGKAVGINIARAGRTETFAIPAEDVEKLLPGLKTSKVSKVAKNDDPKPPKKVEVQPQPKPNEAILTVNGNLTAKDMLNKVRKGAFMKVHEIKLQKDVAYVIDLESTDIDSYLILEDTAGKKLAEDDDSGGFPNARIEFRAPADGTYRIIATTFEPNETGVYTLTVRKK